MVKQNPEDLHKSIYMINHGCSIKQYTPAYLYRSNILLTLILSRSTALPRDPISSCDGVSILSVFKHGDRFNNITAEKQPDDQHEHKDTGSAG